jgi:hypothetical protein
MNFFSLSTCRYADLWQYTRTSGSYASLFELSTMHTNTPMSAVAVTVFVVVVVVIFVVVDINDDNNINNKLNSYLLIC